MVKSVPAVVAKILEASQSLHEAGTFSPRVFEAIFRHASEHEIFDSMETGSGASTLLFSQISQRHLTFALNVGDSLRAAKDSPLLRAGVVTFVEGPTQLTLPAYAFDRKFQLALIDGPHGYPFPDLEYYYIYRHLEENALLIVDDIQIRTINNLFEFLRADDMFRLVEVVDTTAFFRRTSAPTFSPTGDGLATQGYNRQDFEVIPVVRGESHTLKRVPTTTSFWLDELGPIKNPTRRLFVQVPASEPLLAAGWAIDEHTQKPAAWVELVLDGTPYRTDARIPRGDVAGAHSNIGYLRCGFRTALPAERVSPGRHLLALRVIFQGGQNYYQALEIPFTAG